MSKQRIEVMIPDACEALNISRLVNDGVVDVRLRGQISSFGAAVTMGSLLSAVAFFSKRGGAESDRQLLMKVIHRMILPKEKKDTASETSLLDMLIKAKNPDDYKDEIIDAAAAVKLAMNLYSFGDNDTSVTGGA